MKKLKATVISLTALFTFTVASQNNTDASAWHKGTPKFIRGSYRTDRLYKNYKFSIFLLAANKNHMSFQGWGGDGTHIKNIRNKKTKRGYLIKGTEAIFSPETIYFYAKKHNKKFKMKMKNNYNKKWDKYYTFTHKINVQKYAK